MVACLIAGVLFVAGAPFASASGSPVLLVIDEDSIDNGNPPNYFTDTDVNDDIAEIGLREHLPYFAAHEGAEITLYTGEIGDEGWFAPQTIPESWDDAGPKYGDGAWNYWVAGPGLGTPDADGDRESLLDKVPDVAPLREAGLEFLVGYTVCAVVYDSDVSVNYNPLNANLKGANLGVVAFEVLDVYPRTDGSSDSLPAVDILIRSLDVCEGLGPIDVPDVTPTNCDDLGIDFGFKIEGSQSGTYYLTATYGELSPADAPEDPNNYVTITSDGVYLDWTASLGIDAVIVKGGPSAHAYVYSPEATGDTGLHPPINPNTGNPYEISHITFCYDYEVMVEKTVQTSFTRTYDWTIAKDVTPASWDIFRGDSGTSLTTVTVTRVGSSDSDWAVEGTITITNPAPSGATITDVTDVVSGVGDVAVDCGVTLPTTLASLGSRVCTYGTSLPDASERVNTATVTTSGYIGGNADVVPVDFGSAEVSEELASVSVTDTVAGSLGTFTDSGSASYESTFACDTDAGTHDNTATIVETGESASASLTVACHALNVAKTVQTSFTRTYAWTIEKVADQSELVLDPTDEALVNYEVRVDATFTDSDWAAAGTLSIHNPAPRDATLNSVTDVVPDVGPADVDCGVAFPHVLLPGGTLQCTYRVALPNADPRVNTATTTLQNHAFRYDGSNPPSGTTDSSASATVDFGQATITEVDECVDVSDSRTGPLGTVCAGSVPHTFTYTVTLGPFSDPSQCGDNYVTNTATFVAVDTEATGSADWTVHVFVVCRCLLIVDEETIDTDIRSIERAAYSHGVTPAWLINDDRPTLYGNPWLRWNTYYAGDVALLPSGQVSDEGWFALPPEIRYADDVVTFPFYDLDGVLIEDSDDWTDAFVRGTLPQDKLDKVRDVMPLRNQDLVRLVGQTCIAVVYGEVSMNYNPIYANLQGARYGLFAFTVKAVEVPGSLPESQSSTSLYDLWLEVEEPAEWDHLFDVTVRDHPADSVEITRARYRYGKLVVWGTSKYAPGAVMTVSVDGADAGTDPDVDPFLLEAAMTWSPSTGRYEFVLDTPTNLVGRRVTISTDEGGSYTTTIR